MLLDILISSSLVSLFFGFCFFRPFFNTLYTKIPLYDALYSINVLDKNTWSQKNSMLLKSKALFVFALISYFVIVILVTLNYEEYSSYSLVLFMLWCIIFFVIFKKTSTNNTACLKKTFLKLEPHLDTALLNQECDLADECENTTLKAFYSVFKNTVCRGKYLHEKNRRDI